MNRLTWLKAHLYAAFNPAYRCRHRSHRLSLPCLRHFAYQNECQVHGGCYEGFPHATLARIAAYRVAKLLRGRKL